MLMQGFSCCGYAEFHRCRGAFLEEKIAQMQSSCFSCFHRFRRFIIVLMQCIICRLVVEYVEPSLRHNCAYAEKLFLLIVLVLVYAEPPLRNIFNMSSLHSRALRGRWLSERGNQGSQPQSIYLHYHQKILFIINHTQNILA